MNPTLSRMVAEPHHADLMREAAEYRRLHGPRLPKAKRADPTPAPASRRRLAWRRWVHAALSH